MALQDKKLFSKLFLIDSRYYLLLCKTVNDFNVILLDIYYFAGQPILLTRTLCWFAPTVGKPIFYIT